MSYDIKFGIASPLPGVPIKELLNYTTLYEEKGFDSVWFPDHVVFMAEKLTPEVWSVITAAATETDRIMMGAIGDAHRMHPAIFAQRLATVDHISGGRIFVTLGYGEKMNLDPYGIDWDKPLTRVEESAKIMRALWNGQTVDFDGEMFQLSGAELRIQPVGDKIPIYIAATGPKALRVAGRYGDGWVTNAMPSEVYSQKLKGVAEGADLEGKSVEDIEKCIYIFLSIAEGEDEAYKTLDPIKHALIWPELLDDAGYDIKIGDKYKGLQYTKIMPNDKEMLQKFREMGRKYYTREMVLDFVIAGSAEDVTERIERYIEAGVEHFIFRDFSPDREKSINVLSQEIIPNFRYRY